MKNLIVALFITVNCFAQFAGGSGTPEDPYQISTQTQLDLMRNYLSSFFELQNDITLTGSWEPVGSSTNPFTGGFNGNNFKLTNLAVSLGSLNHYGIFGKIEDAQIINVTMKNVGTSTVISTTGLGYGYVGSVVGYSAGNSKIQNVQVDQFTIRISNQTSSNVNNYIGGIVGYNEGYMIDCHVYNYNIWMEIKWTYQKYVKIYAGGIVGYTVEDISKSSAIGNMSIVPPANGQGISEGYIAGAVGYVNNANISNCWSEVYLSTCEPDFALYTCSASSDRNYLHYSGLVSFLNGTVDKCYSILRLKNKIATKTGEWSLFNNNLGTPTITNSFTTNDYIGNDLPSYSTAANSGVSIQDSITMKNIMVYQSASWNFSTTWSIIDTLNHGRPFIRGEVVGFTAGPDTSSTPPDSSETPGEDEGTQPKLPGQLNSECGTASAFHAGSGTAKDPYIITTPGEFLLIREYSGSNYFSILNGLDFKDCGGFIPIGNDESSWSGTIVGNKNVLKNITINSLDQGSTYNQGGVFGSLSNAKIKNVYFDSLKYYIGSSTGTYGFGTISSYKVGLFAGEIIGGSEIDSVIITNATMKHYSSQSLDIGLSGQIGGFVGLLDDGSTINYSSIKFDTLHIFMSTKSPYNFAGSPDMAGFVAKVDGSCSISESSVTANYFYSRGIKFVKQSGFIYAWSGGNNKISNCYTRIDSMYSSFNWNVSAYYQSGFSGDLGSSTDSLINCYTASFVDSTGIYPPADNSTEAFILGNYPTVGALVECHFDGSISGVDDRHIAANSLIKNTTEEMKLEATYSTWDFDIIWIINSEKNEGYPILKRSDLEFAPPTPTYSKRVLGFR